VKKFNAKKLLLFYYPGNRRKKIGELLV